MCPDDKNGPEDAPVYAVSYPPAMYAGEILQNRTFAKAMGYEWLHDEDTDFVRTFREQVQRQSEMYQRWLDGGDPAPSDKGAEPDRSAKR